MKEDIKIEHHGREVDATIYRPNAVRCPVVIFCHGFNGFKTNFRTEAGYLAEHGVGAITFTFCGSGPRDASGFGMTNMTLYTEKEDLFAVMDRARGLEWFDGNLFLFGGSQGGMVAAMAAEDRAADIRGMALLFPAFCIPDNWNNTFGREDAIPETYYFMGVTLGREYFATACKFDVYKKMGEFTKPVLLLHGTADAMVPISYSERAVEIYPSVELVKYEGQGHGFTSAEANQDVRERLLAFVENNSSSN